jgi:hypothetical protein
LKAAAEGSIFTCHAVFSQLRRHDQQGFHAKKVLLCESIYCSFVHADTRLTFTT